MMKRAGIKDVAREAQVSATTVSLVLNGRDAARIPDVTRDRVRRAAERLGYSPNSLARGLATRRSQTIGLVSDQIATTPFAVQMVQAAHEAAWQRGYLLFLLDTGLDEAVEEEAIDVLLRQQVAGLIYAFMHHRVVDAPPALPPGAVFLDGRPRGGGFPAVVPDERAGGRAATAVLVEQGHRRIGFLDDEEHPVASPLRVQGYRDVLRRGRIPFDPALVSRGSSSAEGGRAAAGLLLDLPAEQRPTALFCFNDRMAMGAYRAARHRGLRIPEDLSVVGFDDQPFIAADLDPPLTTVALPHYEMGRWAVETVFAAIDGRPAPEPDVVRMPCPLVPRDSVAPPKE